MTPLPEDTSGPLRGGYYLRMIPLPEEDNTSTIGGYYHQRIPYEDTTTTTLLGGTLLFGKVEIYFSIFKICIQFFYFRIVYY